MTRSPLKHTALPAMLCAALLLSACQQAGESTAESEPGSESTAPSVEPLTGTVTISGSSTVEPISSIVAEDFNAANPGVEYTVDGPGTGDGFVLFCEGKTDISDASRKIKDEEAAVCDAAGIHFIGLKIGIDGISVITDPANDDVTCLSFLDLYALVGPESEQFENWSSADALAAELATLTAYGTSHAPYIDRPLEVTGPGDESGTYDSFIELALAKIAAERGQDTKVTRPDYTGSGDDNVIIAGVGGSDTDSSLGWVGFAFADQNRDQVKFVDVDGGKGCIAATPETIAAGEYPLSRSLYIYVNTDKAAESPALTAFVDYYLSDAGIAAVSEADYVELTADALAESRAEWEAH